MTMTIDFLIFTVLTILVGYRLACGYPRIRVRASDCSRERQWPGHGIEVAPIAARVHQIRSDYASALSSRRPRPGRPSGSDFLASARRSMARRHFFQRCTPPLASNPHDHENHAA